MLADKLLNVVNVGEVGELGVDWEPGVVMNLMLNYLLEGVGFGLCVEDEATVAD